MKLEDKLKDKYGKQNPFNTPDGYFDNFPEQMMKLIPEEPEIKPQKAHDAPRITVWSRLRPYVYLAAMFGGLYFGIKVLDYQKTITKSTDNTENVSTLQAGETEDNYIDDVCNYAGIDREQVYAYATGQNVY